MKSVNEKKIGKNAIGNITKLIVLQCVISDYSDCVQLWCGPVLVLAMRVEPPPWPQCARSPGSRSGQVVGYTLAPAETRQAPLSDPQTETRNAGPATRIKRQ